VATEWSLNGTNLPAKNIHFFFKLGLLSYNAGSLFVITNAWQRPTPTTKTPLHG